MSSGPVSTTTVNTYASSRPEPVACAIRAAKCAAGRDSSDPSTPTRIFIIAFSRPGSSGIALVRVSAVVAQEVDEVAVLGGDVGQQRLGQRGGAPGERVRGCV